MASALSDLVFHLQFLPSYTAEVAVADQTTSISRNDGGQWTKDIQILSANGPTNVEGGDQLYVDVLNIANNSSNTVSLLSFTDVCGRTAQSMARLKAAYFRLLTSDDEGLDTNITNAATSVTIGNAGANIHRMFLSANTHTFDLKAGECLGWASQDASGYNVVANTCNIKFANNDLTNNARVLCIFAGSFT